MMPPALARQAPFAGPDAAPRKPGAASGFWMCGSRYVENDCSPSGSIEEPGGGARLSIRTAPVPRPRTAAARMRENSALGRDD